MKIRPVSEVREGWYEIRGTNITTHLVDLAIMRFDFDVFLPTKHVNLQRQLCWTLEQKQSLMESFIYKRDIPQFIVIARHDKVTKSDYYEVLDGKQRLSAIIEFLDDGFTIPLYDLDGTLYNLLCSELPSDYARVFKFSHINMARIYEEMNEELHYTDDQKIEWFNRINFSGTPQDAEHIKLLKSL